MTNQEKDQITAEIGKEIPDIHDYDNSVPLSAALEWCLRQMGAKI